MGEYRVRFILFSDNKIIINKVAFSITNKINLDQINFSYRYFVRLLRCSGDESCEKSSNHNKSKAKYVIVTNDINDFQPLIIGVNEKKIDQSKRIFTSSICDILLQLL